MNVQECCAYLTEEHFHVGILELTTRDADLGDVVRIWGIPPFWTHPPGFPGMVLAILSQQVSLESAQASYSRLERNMGSITPDAFLSLGDEALRLVGFSRQKTSYAREIALGIVRGGLDLVDLESMENELARTRLMELRGVGPWTADTYLLFALRRPDVWPSRDLALEKAVGELKGGHTVLSSKEVDGIAAMWKPWRAVAARILWFYYLNVRGRYIPD